MVGMPPWYIPREVSNNKEDQDNSKGCWSGGSGTKISSSYVAASLRTPTLLNLC